MKTAFKKGDLVTVLGTWDRKGTVWYQHAIVYSCGLKRMILTNAATGEELGGDFRNPKVGNVKEASGNGGNWYGVFPRMSDVEAEAVCIEAGALMLTAYNAHYDTCIERNGENMRYIKAIQKERAGLHEPRFLKR